MKVDRPKQQRSYITVTNALTRKSLHMTVYDTTPEQVVETLKAAADASQSKPSRRRAS